MLSKRSFFNAGLFRKNLARFWPLWGGLSLLGGVMPLYLLLNLLSPYHDLPELEQVTRAFYEIVELFLPAGCLLYALLAAMAVWSYLFQARSVGLMHALPMDRTGLFLTNAASGMAILLLPFVVVGALTCAVLLGFGILPWTAAAQTVGAVLGLLLFYFSAATLCAVVTGHLLALPVFYFLGNFLAVLLGQAVSSFASDFLFGYVGGGIRWLSALSPTVFFYDHISTEGTYNEAADQWSYHLEGLWSVGVYALVGAALLVLSWALYRRRKSESAGDVVAFRFLRPIFRYGVALACALTLGQLLYTLVWRIPFEGAMENENMAMMWVCMTAAGILGYYAASMLLQKSLRVFRNSWRGPLVTAALLVLLCAGVSFDVFGVESRVPAADQVESLTIAADGRELTLYPADGEMLQAAIDIHRMAAGSGDYVRETRSNGVYSGLVYLDVRYRLKDGGTLTRSYLLPITRERWDGGGQTYDAALNRLFNGPEAAREQITDPMGGTLVYMWYYSYYDDGYGDGEQTETFPTHDVYQALEQDAAEGNIHLLDPFGEEDWSGYLELSFQIPRPEQSYVNYVTLDLSSSMVHTIAALNEAGWLSEEDLAQLQKGGSATAAVSAVPTAVGTAG